MHINLFCTVIPVHLCNKTVKHTKTSVACLCRKFCAHNQGNFCAEAKQKLFLQEMSFLFIGTPHSVLNLKDDPVAPDSTIVQVFSHINAWQHLILVLISASFAVASFIKVRKPCLNPQKTFILICLFTSIGLYSIFCEKLIHHFSHSITLSLFNSLFSAQYYATIHIRPTLRSILSRI